MVVNMNRRMWMKPGEGIKLMDEKDGTCSAAPRSGQLLRVVLQAQL